MSTIQENLVVFRTEAMSRIRMFSENRNLLYQVRETMSAENESRRFMKFADERNYLVSDGYSFGEGLIFDVMATIKTLDPGCKLDISDAVRVAMPLRELNAKPLVNPQNAVYEYRDYQAEAIDAMLKYGRGIINYATGAGKSLVQYGAIINFWERLGRKAKVLLLVPNIQLVSQMHKDFLDYGCPEEDISMFSSANAKTKKFQVTPIVISNRDWMLSRFGARMGAKKENPFSLSEIEMVIVDECHGLGEKMSTYSKFIRKIPTKVKFGFSGTVPSKERVDSFCAYGSVVGTIGPVLKTKRASELQEEGVLADISIMSIVFAHTRKQPEPPYTAFVRLVDVNGQEILDGFGEPKGEIVKLDNLQRAKLRFPMEWDYLEKSRTSNSTMARIVCGLKGNTILLYDHNLHGDILEKMIKDQSSEEKRIFRIFGEVKLDDREDIRAAMEEGDSCILVANTKCFSTGINIRNIRNIVFGFTAGRAAAKIIQSIGRGLRRKENKTSMTLIDISHDYDYSKSHWLERKELYAENYKIPSEKFIQKIVRVDDQSDDYAFTITADNLPKPGDPR